MIIASPHSSGTLQFQTSKSLNTQQFFILRHFGTLVGNLFDQSLELWNLDREKSQFLANIFHEIKTPLNGILATLDLIKIQVHDDSLTPLLEIVSSSGRHLEEIVRDLLDLSKAQSGRIEIEFTEFQISDVLQEIENIFLPIAFKKGISFEVHHQIPKGTWGKGDPLRIKQVIANLISNAIKFTDTGQVLLRVHIDAAFMHITVIDTGVGIPLRSQHRIFQPFMQADSSTTRKYGGTGLGLTITQTFVDLMNGKIEFESQEGVGTKFHVQIPFTKSLAPTSKPPSTTDNNLNIQFRDTHVLLVEDNPINQLVGKEILISMGCAVETCNHGGIALERLNTEVYDLVFMDWMMPIMDGIQATKKIREMGLKNLPIIALTANSSESDKKQCLSAGMNDFIAKPFRLADFSHILNKWIDDKKKIHLGGIPASSENYSDYFIKDIYRLTEDLKKSNLAPLETKNIVHQLKTNLRFIREMSLAELAQQIETDIESQPSGNWKKTLDTLLTVIELKDLLGQEVTKSGKVAS